MQRTPWLLAAALLAVFAFAACGSDDTVPIGDKPPVIDAGPDAVSCASGQSTCGNGCTDVKTDPENCGACNRRCNLAESCVDGTCHPACTGDTIECDGTCVDPLHDASNCGGCGKSCGAGEACDSGICSLTCSGGSTKCGSACVDVENDPANCGGCAQGCASGEVCVNGTCDVQCPPGTSQCGNQCFATGNDPSNCGGCGNACAADELCSGGKCGVVCLGGAVECNGKCVDTANDPNNCGTCGKSCGVGYDCVAGGCTFVCGQDSVLCGTKCVNPLSDPNNCGGCGKHCAINELCANGTCAQDCTNLTVCSGKCVDTDTDSKNCGSCGTVCASTEVCIAGGCQCPTGYQACGGTCLDTQADPFNCGGCGVGCNSTEVCTAGKCVCKTGWSLCGSACFDLKTSSKHCGSCGAPCAVGKVCTNGTCAAATGAWPTLGGDVEHSGYNTAETGKPPLYLAWKYQVLDKVTLQPAVVSGGRVFTTTVGAYNAVKTPAVALNVSDGSLLWEYDFLNVSYVGQPGTFGGYLYVATGAGSSNYPHVWKLDGSNGSIAWSVVTGSSYDQYWAPIVVNSVVYTNAGSYGYLYALSDTDGSEIFLQALSNNDQWSPAYSAGTLFTYIKGVLRAHNPQSGVELWSQAVTAPSYNNKTAPALANGHAYVVAAPNLHAINLTTHAVDWTATGSYTGMAAVAGKVVYGLSAKHLVARDADTGALVGTFAGDGLLSYPPVIAGDYVYVASDSNVYAVDRTTFKSAWTAPSGGWLTIADKRLFIAKTNGTLEAYVFQN